MIWGALADLVVLVHLAFIVFAALGGFLVWRWRAAAFVHLPALAWAAWIALTGRICPLTPLENRLRGLAGQQGYSGGFIEYYLMPLIYPVELTREVQWLLAAALLVLNGVAYGLLVRRAASSSLP